MPKYASPAPIKQEEELMRSIWQPELFNSPYNFVKAVFPWGKPNTPLATFREPRAWQIDEMKNIERHILQNHERMGIGLDPEMYHSATASGRGVGKSALTSWLILWMLSTRPGATCIVSANTEAQLKTRTWAELGKWHTLAVNSHWFERAALSLRPKPWFEELLQEQEKIDTGYYAAWASLWSAENPDAFAGVHNQAGTLLIFDEASGIPESIWGVAEGFFTEPVLDRYWFCFSNPRRNTGAFFECFHSHRAYWNRRNLDSRTVEGTDKSVLNKIIEKHGEDSDAARIEVMGQFPRQGDRQFISRDVVDMAIERELQVDPYAPLIMGVDPARYGDDETVIRFRKGRDAKSIPPVTMKGMDNIAVAEQVAYLIRHYDPDMVNIDGGSGAGVIDRLREAKFVVREVLFGSKPSDGKDSEWGNRRTEMWAKMRDWLGGGCIDNMQDLKDDLVGPEYRFQLKTDKVILESKEDMKARGVASPNHGDALALTFDGQASRRDLKTSSRNPNLNRHRMAAGMDENLL